MEVVFRGWMPEVVDFEMTEATQDQVNVLGKLLAEHTAVLFRNQRPCTLAEESDFCGKFGEMELVPVASPHKEFLSAVLHPNDEYVVRVTGKLNDKGLPGLHGHKGDLDWHCNRVFSPDRKPLVYLKSIQGSVGSRTSWINSVMAYADLPPKVQEHIATLRLKPTSAYNQYSDTGKIFNLPSIVTPDYYPEIVQTNPIGKKSIYFSFLQLVGAVDRDNNTISNLEWTRLHKFLKTHMLKEKYMYHHDWADGDVIISDQWCGLHKRWAFEAMEQRLLNRVTMDYSNIKFDQ